jgi:hypothetical protein
LLVGAMTNAVFFLNTSIHDADWADCILSVCCTSVWFVNAWTERTVLLVNWDRTLMSYIPGLWDRTRLKYHR